MRGCVLYVEGNLSTTLYNISNNTRFIFPQKLFNNSYDFPLIPNRECTPPYNRHIDTLTRSKGDGQYAERPYNIQ